MRDVCPLPFRRWPAGRLGLAASVGCLLGLVNLAIGPAAAQPPAATEPAAGAPAAAAAPTGRRPGPLEERAAPPVPLGQVYSRLELGLAGGAAAAALTLAGLRPVIGPHIKPSLGDPAPESLDARVTRAVYRKGTGRLWGGVPDVGGYVYPLVAVAAYGTELALNLGAGRRLGGDRHAGYPAIALAEALVVSELATLAANYGVGRRRPSEAPEFGGPTGAVKPSEINLAFYSGHSAIAFTTSSFLSLAIGSGLARRWQARPALRIAVARVLLPLALYGLAAFVAYARIADGQHYLSDVAAGAVAGTLVGNLFYLVHFDLSGEPRVTRARGGSLGQLGIAPWLGSGGRSGLSLTLAR